MSGTRAELDRDPGAVARMFDGVAARYDLTNTVLSFAQDVRWRRATRAALTVGPGDTVLIGAAAGGVGVFAVQLARMAGARVIGTGSASSAKFLRDLGAEPVSYGDGLADRVRAFAPDGVTAAIDLYGTETVQAARELGVPDGRITSRPDAPSFDCASAITRRTLSLSSG